MVNENSKNRLFVLTVIATISLCLFIYFAKAIIIPFVLAAFISYLISPLVKHIQSFALKRWLSVIIVIVGLLLILTTILIFLIPQISIQFQNLTMAAPRYLQYLSDQLLIIKDKLNLTFPIIQKYDVWQIASEKLNLTISSWTATIPTYLKNVISFFSAAILIPMLVFFMLLGGRSWIDIMVDALPSNITSTVMSVIYEIDSMLGRYIRGQIIESIFIAIMISIALTILGINFALLIGIFAGIANLIPFLGSIVGATIACLVGIVEFGEIFIIFKIIPAFIVIQFIDNHLVQPLVLGLNVNLSPIAIIFAILTGAHIFGIIGMLFAVPLLAIIKSIFFLFLKKYKDSLMDG